MPDYEFAGDDLFEPVYCARCRAHIPRANLDTNGLCDACRELIVHEQVENAAIAKALSAAENEIAEERRQRIHDIDTGQGVCPACGSRNVRTQRFATGGTAVARGLTSLFIGPVSASLLFGRHRQRVCAACGEVWK